MEENNIYLMDKPIADINKDEFDHKSIVDEIIKNIEKNKPPYNIALIGKWGTGKSSILECVKNNLETDKDNKYLFANINAWKYEKQELRKYFILEILDKLPNTSKNDSNFVYKVRELLDSVLQVNGEEKNESEKIFINWKKIIKDVIEKLLVIILPILIMYILFLLITDFVLNKNNVQIPDYNGIRLDICGSLIVSILVEIIAIINDAIASKKIFNINIKENSKDCNFYEEQMKKAIDIYKRKNKNFKSLVCVVEDIDRLNAEKIVEAISALKSFIGINDLIFIVPYDTNILSAVLERNKNSKIYGNIDILEGELILNKLFQFKVYMPELIQEDMYEYIKNLIEKENSEIYNIFPSKEILIDDILPILMYEGVKTPRDAKQLVNSFIIKYNIAINRNVIDCEKMNNDDIKILSVLTVLENDFNEFYSQILMYPTIINDFLELEKNNKEDNQIYRKFKEKIYKGRKFKELLAFLKYTTTIKIENVERFVYLNDSKIDKVNGGKIGKDFRSAVTNFDVKTARKVVGKIDSITDMVNREISYNSGNILKKKNIILTLVSIYDMFNNDFDKTNVRDIIENNIEILEITDYSNINVIALLKIILDDKEKQYEKIINVLRKKLDNWVPIYFYFEDENIDEIDEKNLLDKELEMFLDAYPSLDEITQEKIRNLLNKIGNYSITESDVENGYKVYTFIDYYNFVKATINEKNYYIIKENFLKNVIIYVKDGKIEMEELEILKDIYIKNKDFNIFAIELIEAFKDELADKILECLRLLQSNLNEIHADTKNAIFKIINNNSTDILELDEPSDIDSILAAIIIDVLKDDNDNDVDALLNKLNENIYVIETVEKIAKNNLLEKIPNTILAINKELSEEENTDYFEMFRKIHSKYTTDAKKDLFNKLYKAIPNYKENINRIEQIFKTLNIKNNRGICEEFVLKIIDYLNTNFSSFSDRKVRNNLLYFSIDNVNLIQNEPKEAFFDFINEKVYAVNPKLAIECSSKSNFNDISEEKWKESIEKYLESTKLELINYIGIIDKQNNILRNNSDLKEQFIDKIIDEFEPNDEFLSILKKINLVECENIIKIYNLFTEYIESPQVIDCLKNILENNENIQEVIEKLIKEDLEIDLIIKLSHQTEKINIESIIKNILEKYKSGNENFELNSKMKLLRFIAERFRNKKKFKDEFILLSTDIVNSIDISEINEVVDILISNKRILNKDNRKMLINKLEVTIEKMDENDKKEINNKIEQFK